MTKKGTDHKLHLARLSRIEGQIRGISKMVEEQKYCINILTQIKAARSALKSIELLILEGHLDHCVKNAVNLSNKKESEAMISEIMGLLKKTFKS